MREVALVGVETDRLVVGDEGDEPHLAVGLVYLPAFHVDICEVLRLRVVRVAVQYPYQVSHRALVGEAGVAGAQGHRGVGVVDDRTVIPVKAYRQSETECAVDCDYCGRLGLRRRCLHAATEQQQGHDRYHQDQS